MQLFLLSSSVLNLCNKKNLSNKSVSAFLKVAFWFGYSAILSIIKVMYHQVRYGMIKNGE
jgi:hypothetical protein